MSAPSTIAAALASLLDTAPSWLPQVDHWEIAEDTDTWVLSGQLAGDLREAEAFRLLAPMMERAKTAHSDDGRLVKVPFEWDGVPGQVWYLRPVERYVVPERCATCPTLLAGAGNQFVRLGGRGAPVICVPCRDRMHEAWVREAAVRELGALPMPAGPEPQQPRTVLDRARAVLGARLPKDDLRLALGSVIDYATELKRQRNVFRDQRNNVVATNEQLLAKVEESGQARLRAENDARTLTRQVAELEAAPRTVYRAAHDSIPMGLYTTAAEARKHCETELRREWPNSLLDWIEDEEDAVAELVAENADGETPTGYVVEALEVAARYDAEADE
ncbi:hypothetical protein ACFVOO_15995 [Streptomyces rochei]|uniref:hypothetical protein n=1 Tax=Streptomyces rochei TaxID=1928 RepID=UPI00369EE9B6